MSSIKPTSNEAENSNKLKPLLDEVKGLFKRKDKISENIFYITYKEIPFSIPGRRMGNTTRLVDSFVQDFFIKGSCKVYDHYGSSDSCRRTFDLVLLRLKNEHGIDKEKVKIDRNRLVITNVNFR